MKKLFVLAAFALGLSSVAAQAQTILAANLVGPVNQVNVLTLQAAETNTLGGLVLLNDIDTQAAGNSASVSQTNDLALLTLNAQGGINQVNLATAQLARTNTAGVFVVLNDIDTQAIGNVASVDQTNSQALGVVNAQAGINQVNAVTLQAAQTNTLGLVVAGNAITTVAAGNAASVVSTN